MLRVRLFRLSSRRLGEKPEDPRWYLNVTGERLDLTGNEHYENHDTQSHAPPLNICEERGHRWIKPHPRLSLEEVYGLPQDNLFFTADSQS